MAAFTISLAGIPIAVSPCYSTISDYFVDYRCDETPLFSVSASFRDIEYERTEFNKRRQRDGLAACSSSDVVLEAMALLRAIANRIIDYNVLLFHSSVIAVDGKAYIFTAPSHTGKTTHTRLWLEQLPQAHVLNGDKPFLKVEANGRILACGTPWRGKEHYGVNEMLPLEAICLLERDETNHIEAISFKEALNTLILQTHLPNDPLSKVKAIQLIGRVGQSVKLYQLGCNMNPEAARVSIHAMLSREEHLS